MRTRHPARARGFSLLPIIMILIVIGVLGSAGLLLAQTDVSISAGRAGHASALVAAEDGLATFALTARTSFITPGAPPATWTALPPVDRDGDGVPDLWPLWRVWGTSVGDVDTASVRVDGVIAGDPAGQRVLGRASLGTTLYTLRSDGRCEQAGCGPRGTNTSGDREPIADLGP